jgi:hypothetical protein
MAVGRRLSGSGDGPRKDQNVQGATGLTFASQG